MSCPCHKVATDPPIFPRLTLHNAYPPAQKSELPLQTKSLIRVARPLLTASAVLMATSAMADMMLPSPYISRALDAVLLPIDDAVVAGFALHPDDTGALVLAVQPGGIAEAYGILPGDVVSFVGGVPVSSPIDLDTIVYYWISLGTFDFVFDGYRGMDTFNVASVISAESYAEVIEVTSVESWSSYSYESFSYSEFYAEYSSEMTETYASSETSIEETASSEEFIAEVETAEEQSSSDEMVSEDAMADADGDGVADEADTDGAADEAAIDDGAADAAEAEEVAPAEEEAVAEDAPVEEDAVEEDAQVEEGAPAEEESAGEEAPAEE